MRPDPSIEQTSQRLRRLQAGKYVVEHGMQLRAFARDGFASLPGLVSAQDCDSLAALAASASRSSRCLLPQPWCSALASRLRERLAPLRFVHESFAAVQCTYFEKSASRNWLVPVHQDLSIPVLEHVVEPSLCGWSKKEGVLFVQAPMSLLEQLVAVRVHLDRCSEQDGPLRVVPGSHTHGCLEPAVAVAMRKTIGEVTCVAEQGGALVMRPLLLHASSKAGGVGMRRVLHFLFGPRELPHGLAWHHAV